MWGASVVRAAACAAVLVFVGTSCEAPTPEASAGQDAARPAAPAAAPHWAQDESDIPADPAVRYGVLDNGFRYALMANATPPGAAAMWFQVEAGSLQEEDDQRGLAHLLEHMAFNGSESFAEGEAVRALERAGVALGGDANAYTDLTATRYRLFISDASEETLGAALTLFSDIADKLTLDPQAVDQERGVVEAERRGGNQTARAAGDAVTALQFAGHRVTERNAIGLSDVIEHAPVERLRAYYETWYRPDNASLVFVGDADLDAIEAQVREKFGPWARPATPIPTPDVGAIDPDRAPAADVFVDPAAPNQLVLSVIGAPSLEPDTFQIHGDRYVANLATAMLARRLQSIAADADAPFISAVPILQLNFQHAGDQAQILTSIAPGDWRPALEALEHERRRALEYGFTESELAEVLARAQASLQAMADRADTRFSPQLATELHNDIRHDRVFAHPRTWLARFEATEDTVTLDRVNGLFRKFWGGPPLAFVSSTEPVDGGAEAVLSALQAAMAAPVAPPEERTVGAFAYDDFGPPGEVAERTRIDDLDVTEVVFANGVRLNVKSTDFQDNMALVGVSFGRGLVQTAHAERPSALRRLISTLLVSGGLEAHSQDELASIFAGQGVSIGGGLLATDDRFMIPVTTKPDALELQLKLLAARFFAQGYRPETLARFRRSQEASYDGYDDTPQSVEANVVNPLVRGDQPWRVMPAKDDLLAVDLEDARAVLQPELEEGYLEVAVVGDIDVEAAITAAAATFGVLPPRRDAPAPLAQDERATFPAPTAEPVVLRHEGAPNQARLLIYWPTTDDSDAQLARTLDLLSGVLGDKLRERVREQDGTSYAPGVMLDLSSVDPGFGLLRVGLDATPADAATYFDVVDEIAAAMAAGEVTEDELERARRPRVDALAAQTANNGYWANLLVTAQRTPRRLEEQRTARAGLEAITREDVIAAAARYLDPDTAFRVAVLPADDATDADGP